MTVRIGLLAASRIAVRAVLEPAASVDGVEVTAVAARDPLRAREMAVAWGIGSAFDSYEELVASDEIDAVYIGTPAALHRRWSSAAIEAGLHVLCEKPLAANAADAALVASAAAASDRVVMEAFHWRYHPFVDTMRAGLEMLGPLSRVDAWFEVEDGRIGPGDIRWNMQLGGGSTMDLGCYAVAWGRWVVGSDPVVVSAVADATPDGVDAWLTAELAWQGGISGSVHSSMVAPVGEGRGSGIVATGRHGTLQIDNPLAPQRGSTMTLDTPAGTEATHAGRSNTYFHQLVAFRDAVELGAAYPTTAADGVANMAVVDECYLAAGLPARPTFE
ncbi:MAG: Gfo/Idh/MocA family oxidoreductase [Acidimicrobiia bacterium]